MSRMILMILSAAVCWGQTNALATKEAAEGWVLLFDGESLFGWSPQGGAKWRVENGAILADSGESGYLRSNAVFADYILKLEFRTAADGNSGIFLRSAKDGQPHVTGYELQIYDKHERFPTGSLVNHVRGKPARIRDGQWQAYEVEFRGDHITAKLDGKTVLDAKEGKSLIGHIGLQYNKDKKIEFRNIRLKPLGLTPIFNGKNLDGWREVKHPRVKEAPVWSVNKSLLHVEKGPGQLETEAAFNDFILQLDIRANSADPSRHPNSGVFLRGDPNGSWTGYESQIRNEYKEDRTKPVDFGTGGIYHYQPTRKVVANDNQFFTKTIIARGRQFSVWVNGYPVTSWEDPHPEGTIVRQKQAKLTAGVISLQAHDPTTNLDFRNLRIVKLPR
jgi:hypothetical protein